MKRLLLALALLAAVWACAHVIPPLPPNLGGTIILEAQSLPINKTLFWTDVDGSITSYTVTQDGTTIGTPAAQSQPFTVTVVGSHTFTVTSTNLWGTSAPVTLTVIVQLPTVPSGLGVR